LGGEAWGAAPVIHARDGYTYLGNGSWRESDSTAEFLCHSLAATAPGQGTIRVALPALARPPLPSVGQVVDGHYRIVSILGEGEDAVVYLACDTQEGTEYVLKAFREPRETFDQRRVEFAALQRISHPGVPRVHEIHGWEHPFHLRMDHVAGTALKACRGEFQGDLTAVARLGAAVCGAFHAVHMAGLVHRDVAPDNILIPEDPSNPVRLVDFDMVAPVGTVGPAGTSLYRPPESESGAPWTRASDIYSLGVVLFELLTGRLPYRISDDGTERHPVEERPDEFAAFGDVIRVLQRAASLDPPARYATARGFLQALRTAARTVTAQD
jgi:eukaryotic-like serine/threonine-protein kinase